MKISDKLTTPVIDPKRTRRKYPKVRITILDDNSNTFDHVANYLVRNILVISKKNLDFLYTNLIVRGSQKYGEDLLSSQNSIMSNSLVKDYYGTILKKHINGK